MILFPVEAVIAQFPTLALACLFLMYKIMWFSLAKELLMHDALADRSRVVYDPYTPEQQQGIRRQLEKFVAAQVNKQI